MALFSLPRFNFVAVRVSRRRYLPAVSAVVVHSSIFQCLFLCDQAAPRGCACLDALCRLVLWERPSLHFVVENGTYFSTGCTAREFVVKVLNIYIYIIIEKRYNDVSHGIIDDYFVSPLENKNMMRLMIDPRGHHIGRPSYVYFESEMRAKREWVVRDRSPRRKEKAEMRDMGKPLRSTSEYSPLHN